MCAGPARGRLGGGTALAQSNARRARSQLASAAICTAATGHEEGEMQVNSETIWNAVQEELRFQLAKPSYETWLKNATLVSAEGSTYRIGVPSKLAKDWLEDRFAGLIQETLQAVTGT